MTSNTPTPFDYIVWIFNNGSSGPKSATILGPCFKSFFAHPGDEGKEKRRLLVTLTKADFDPHYIDKICNFVHPENGRNEIPANSIIEGKLKTGEAHKVIVMFEEAGSVATDCRDGEQERKLPNLWIVFKQDITGVKEFEDIHLEFRNWKNGKPLKDVIVAMEDVIVESLSPHGAWFDACILKEAVKTFTSGGDAMRHAKTLLKSENSLVVDMLESKLKLSCGAVATGGHVRLVSLMRWEPDNESCGRLDA